MMNWDLPVYTLHHACVNCALAIKIKLQQARVWEEKTQEVNQLATAGKNQQQSAYFPECILKLWINYQMVISMVI